ncbi:hypothetical protein PF010_g6426 [Phytophthora fragariae]|uniref:Uncharacterized protein n=1 Tax=Phytophthora fragariae TaxID=53985 RepID=A0A6A3SV47_9STRA|nr:hypothetical protein PF010_g6426 [Phytophthora fragariae]KAE9123587.1 hypothetical protein PF007_g7000 [Phytophthora fragariae]KAE9244398.1 hypothetical protein PF002_g7779 [Phytophthora fragariae]
MLLRLRASAVVGLHVGALLLTYAFCGSFTCRFSRVTNSSLSCSVFPTATNRCIY